MQNRNNFFLNTILTGLLLSTFSTVALAQEMSPLDSSLRRLATEKDPHQLVTGINQLAQTHGLDKSRDAETFDVLYGMAAVGFAMAGDTVHFEKYLDSIQNPFNKTSFLNTTVSQLLDQQADPRYARRLAERTISLYEKIKADSTARPADFPKAAWDRFMDFAQYPYHDSYARALFASNELAKALIHQRKAFDGLPEEGMPEAVERYARLLELNGKKAEARELLIRRARVGKLNAGMTAQLQSIYIEENGNDEQLGRFLDSLQANVQLRLAEELKPRMLNIEAPGFSIKDINGKKVSLSDFKGRIVVLDLWATWCKPCIASFPAMQLMVKKHPEVAFLFIAVQEQDANPLPRVRSFIEKRNYNFQVLIDEPVKTGSSEYKIISSYRPNGIPAKYIIDKKGVLRFHTSGFDTDAELINELEAMFSILHSL